MNPVKYYFDLLSQPSRALYILLKLNNVSFQPIEVALRKGEHLTEEFKMNINRFQKVPCIVDGEFKLSESIAILRYLDGKNLISDQWYPKNLRLRAKVDEYLEWQHNNTRAYCAMYFWKKWLEPVIMGKESNPNTVTKLERNVDCTLNIIENIWLKDQKFIALNSVTIADIFAACEIEQTRVAEYDPFKNRPNLTAWYTNVRDATNPYYDEAHKYVFKMIKKNQNPTKSKI